MKQLPERRNALKESILQFQHCIKVLEKAFPQLQSLGNSATSDKQVPSSKSSEKCYRTHKGDYVRSKSEVMIANKLYANQIPYDYEKTLILEGYSNPFLPDFTICTPNIKPGILALMISCSISSDCCNVNPTVRFVIFL